MLQDDPQTEAVAWLLRLREGDGADWAHFTSWLEKSPANEAAYDAVATADQAYGAWVAETAPAPASNDNIVVSTPRRFRMLGWSAAAAVLLAGLGFGILSPASTSTVETRPGEHRTVTFSDGTRIDLNGDTRITLRRGDSRFASVDRGEAAFAVVHHSSDPFTVEVGGKKLQDVGTVFDVVRTASGSETAVAEGAVLYNPGKEAIRLDAGNRLVVADGTAKVMPVQRDAVASWRHHRLIFDHAPLSKVAEDLTRNLGISFAASPDIADRPFSGTIKLDGNHAPFEKLGMVLDVAVVRQTEGWQLAPRAGAGR